MNKNHFELKPEARFSSMFTKVAKKTNLKAHTFDELVPPPNTEMTPALLDGPFRTSTRSSTSNDCSNISIVIKLPVSPTILKTHSIAPRPLPAEDGTVTVWKSSVAASSPHDSTKAGLIVAMNPAFSTDKSLLKRRIKNPLMLRNVCSESCNWPDKVACKNLTVSSNAQNLIRP